MLVSKGFISAVLYLSSWLSELAGKGLHLLGGSKGRVRENAHPIIEGIWQRFMHVSDGSRSKVRAKSISSFKKKGNVGHNSLPLLVFRR